MDSKYIKKDCFAYDAEKDQCRILSETVCIDSRHCPFYKDKQQFKSGKNKFYLKERLYRQGIRGDDNE